MLTMRTGDKLTVLIEKCLLSPGHASTLVRPRSWSNSNACSHRIIGFGIERASIDGIAGCRMFNHAVAGRPPPKHVSTDHDPLLRFHRWRANLRVREIEEVKSVPYAPVSHPFVERLIGTIRREYLDRVFFWSAADLARKLEAFRDYYNGHRVHRAIAGLTPAQFAGALSPAPAALDHYGWQQHCRGLFELPIAA